MILSLLLELKESAYKKEI